MKIKMTGTGLLLTLIAAYAPICGATGFKDMAKELSRAAKSAGIERIAVLPFVPADGSNVKDGWNLSEKLITQVVRAGKVQVVERSLLRNLMEEHHLAQTGMLNPAMLKKIGQVTSVEAIITGSFVTSSREFVVNARLINVETGVIIAAVEHEEDRDWLNSATFSNNQLPGLWVPAPEFTVEAPSMPAEDSIALKDAPADTSCIGAAERVDRLEGQILELKARYWANQLKKGISLASIKVNPGSTISDPTLKKAFYERMKHWYEFEKETGLTPQEVQRFISIDGKAYALYRECGV